MRARILKITASSLSAVLVMGAFAMAEAGVNRRQARQQARIGQGVASGELTAREYMGLQRASYRIATNEARARSDGEFTCRERARINHQLNRENRQIYKQKHDKQDRP